MQIHRDKLRRDLFNMNITHFLLQLIINISNISTLFQMGFKLDVKSGLFYS